MSQDLNADGSITDGVKVEAWGKFVSHQIGLHGRALHFGRHHADNDQRLCDPRWLLDHFERVRRCQRQVYFDVDDCRHDQRGLSATGA